MDMDAVGDDLRRGRRRNKRGADDARLTMMHPGHRVEEVREVARAPFQRRNGVAVIRRSVADREDDTVSKVLDERADAFDLRRDGDDPAQMRRFVEQRADFLDVSGTNGLDALRAGALGADVWPLEVNGAD